MKHYIYTHKRKKRAVSFAEFLEHLKYQTKIEKESEKCLYFYFRKLIRVYFLMN